MDLQARITKANSLLASYAVPHGTGHGRVNAESEDATRFPFQRDRDRIIHSVAFRRLKHKTQVFVANFGDHYRTRLTHTLEVAQISRDMARTLGLNEDLAECIALAHDVGHTPFGHAGEEALNICMQKFGKHFEHNEQSYRTCTTLEKRKPNVFGLNLNREVLDGLLKHATPHDDPKSDIPTITHAPSLEAQVVNLADEIAYTAHDAEDGDRAKLFSLEELIKVLPEPACTRVAKKDTSVRSALIDTLVNDAYAETERALQKAKISTLENVYSATSPLILFSKDMSASLKKIRAFLWQRMYLHGSVQEQATRGKEIITQLFELFLAHPPSPVLTLQERIKCPTEDAVRDYIAGMTDRFAISVSAKRP